MIHGKVCDHDDDVCEELGQDSSWDRNNIYRLLCIPCIPPSSARLPGHSTNLQDGPMDLGHSASVDAAVLRHIGELALPVYHTRCLHFAFAATADDHIPDSERHVRGYLLQKPNQQHQQ